MSFDFSSPFQKDQGKSIPTMVAKEHRTCYTTSLTCPGKSLKEEEYSDQIVHRCKVFVEQLWYTRIA